MDDVTVTAIWTTPVKALALHPRDEVFLGAGGVKDNRAFYLVDDRRRMVNNKRLGELMTVRAELSAAADLLRLRFDGGRVLEEPVQDGAMLSTTFFSRQDQVRAVCPELSAALSELAGEELQLMRADPAETANDRGPKGVVSLLSRASLDRLGAEAQEDVDPRRFRMLLEIDGVAAHGEDSWVGESVQIGSAIVRFGGHVGRCRVTTMDPETGEQSLATLDLLSYRRGLPTTEPLAFGIYGSVLEPGTVRVGDRVRGAPAVPLTGAPVGPASGAAAGPLREA